MNTIGFIGLGNMGSAILSSVAKSSLYNTIAIFDIDDNKCNSLKNELQKDNVKITIYSNISELVNDCEIVMLCVKPQILPSLYSQIKKLPNRDPLYISIAAGVSTQTLKQNILSDRIIRFMPNLAAKCSKSVTAVCGCANSGEQDKNIALNIAKTFGQAFFLDEKLFSAFIGISGSAIAFVYEFAHNLALGGTHEGINYDKSLEIVFATIDSAKSLYEEDKENPISLMTKVCSAGGTTIEGIKTLSDYNFSSAIINSVINTTEKSKDLEKK